MHIPKFYLNSVWGQNTQDNSLYSTIQFSNNPFYEGNSKFVNAEGSVDRICEFIWQISFHVYDDGGHYRTKLEYVY